MIPGAAANSKNPLTNLSLMEQELGATIFSSLICPVPKCCNYLFPPIRQCKEGHTLCIVCLENKSQTCPLCKKHILPVHNVALENIARKLLVACKHREMGCPETTLKNRGSLMLHELQCPYRPYSCFAQKCSWKGRSTELCLHVAENHSERVFAGEEKLFKIKKMDNRGDLDLQTLMTTAFGSFWVRIIFQKENGLFFGAVQYLGPRNLAENCRYQFDISVEHQGTKKQLIYSRNTHEDTLCFDKIFQSGDCFCMPLDFARYLSVNSILQIKLNLEHIKPK